MTPILMVFCENAEDAMTKVSAKKRAVSNADFFMSVSFLLKDY